MSKLVRLAADSDGMSLLLLTEKDGSRRLVLREASSIIPSGIVHGSIGVDEHSMREIARDLLAAIGKGRRL